MKNYNNSYTLKILYKKIGLMDSDVLIIISDNFLHFLMQSLILHSFPCVQFHLFQSVNYLTIFSYFILYEIKVFWCSGSQIRQIEQQFLFQGRNLLLFCLTFRHGFLILFLLLNKLLQIFII